MNVDYWLLNQLATLSKFQFSNEGLAIYDQKLIKLIDQEDIHKSRDRYIYIPTNFKINCCEKIYKFDFGNTNIKTWNPIDISSENLKRISSGDVCVWFENESGGLIPSWDFWGNMMESLTFREEEGFVSEDIHQRFSSKQSYKSEKKLLNVPILNDFNAVLLDAMQALKFKNKPKFSLKNEWVSPVGLSISHDIDQLKGNDLFTLLSKVSKIFIAMRKLKFKKIYILLKSLLITLVFPYKFYKGNLQRMINLEKKYGFSSNIYFLVGKQGRFGARSKNINIKKFINIIPKNFNVGVHYNYWSARSVKKIKSEIKIIEKLFSKKVSSGRAHYLAYDALTNPVNIEKCGIELDESIGWYDEIGFKAGIAGPFIPWSRQLKREVNVIHNPLTLMDSLCWSKKEEVVKIIHHLESVGGLITLNCHPDASFFPEVSNSFVTYEKFLMYFAKKKAKNWSAKEIKKIFNSHANLN